MARSKSKKRLIVAVLLVVVVVAWVAWHHLLREVDTEFASDVEHFKYGSVGVEAASGLPYWIWRVMPQVCAHRLPDKDGYGSFGFIFEADKNTPIGLPLKTVGFPRVGINCGLCHTATVRTSAGDPPRTLMGAPSSTIDLQGYLRFLFACADDARFTPDNVLEAIEDIEDLSWIETLLYRHLIIPQTQEALLRQKAQLAWMDRGTDWGPGRQDPFNPAKTQILGLPYDGSIGNADIPPLWNWAAREGHALHWDGLNTSLTEIFLNSGIGNGASPDSVDIDSLERIQKWVQTLPPARYPFTVNAQLAGTGKTIYTAHCAECHAPGGDMNGYPVRIELLGTDRHRLDSWSQATADAFNGLDIYDWNYREFRGSHGYMAVPLDGLWIRAPYLHNGSVPSLRDLLEPPQSRPALFYTGYDVYDPEAVGFTSNGPEAEQAGFRFDTSLPGNGNGGHLWGTGLAPGEKQALIEYLKTL